MRRNIKASLKVLQDEIKSSNEVLKDKSWGKHVDGLDERHRTHRQILKSEIFQHRKAFKILSNYQNCIEENTYVISDDDK